MGIKEMISKMPFFAARLKRAPERDTLQYPRLMNLGVTFNQKAQVKPAPPNLRYFSRTPYARAAIRRIRDSIQRLEWEIVPAKGVKRNSVIDKQIAVATACFEHPNNDLNWQEFIGQVVEDWLIWGAGVIEQQMSNNPIRPIWFWPVDAQSIQIFAGWSGATNEPRYMQTIGYSNVGFLEGRALLNKELIYIRANSSTETPYGFGPLEIAFNTINRQLGVAEFTGNLASNAQPQILLHFPDVDNTTLRSFRDYWRNEVEGQGMTPMFGGPKAPESVELHPGGDDALYLQYQEFVIREIATSFGLSPMNMGISKDVNRNTAEVEEDRDWDNAVVPPAELFANHFTKSLHSRLGFYQLKFQFKGLYREDEESKATIYSNYYKNNRITPNMSRIESGLPPMENKWADMTFAETQIALSAARGAKVLETPDQLQDQDLGEANPPPTDDASKTSFDDNNDDQS